MGKVVQVCMGGMSVGKDNVVFSTGGIGSCVVICMFDKERRIGGLAHSMLPKKRELVADDGDSEAKYVDQAILNLISKLVHLGANKDALAAKLVGGATMFNIFHGRDQKSIGEQNIEIAHDELRRHNIKLMGEDVGGTSGKMAEFNVANAILNVNLKI